MTPEFGAKGRAHAAQGLPPRFHRKAAPCTAQAGTIPQQPSHGLHVQRGGHDQQAQVGAQGGPAFQAEGQAQIGLERALVEFVENHAGCLGQFRVGLQQAGQHALGNDFNASVRADEAFLAHAPAHGLPRLLAEQAGHVAAQSPCGHAARLQQQNLAACRPGRVQQPEGHAAALARAGRGAEHQAAAALQEAQQLGAQFVHGTGGPGRAGRTRTAGWLL